MLGPEKTNAKAHDTSSVVAMKVINLRSTSRLLQNEGKHIQVDVYNDPRTVIVPDANYCPNITPQFSISLLFMYTLCSLESFQLLRETFALYWQKQIEKIQEYNAHMHPSEITAA